MRTSTQYHRNQQGFSVIELIVVMGITTVLMGAAIYTFTKQEKVIRTEQSATQIRAAGRNGINELAKELRRVGYGMPRGHGLYSVGTNYVYWWVNTDEATSNVTVDVNAGDLGIEVQDSKLLKTNTGGLGYLMLRTVKKQDQWDMVKFNSSNLAGTRVNVTGNYNVLVSPPCTTPCQAHTLSGETVQLSKMKYQRVDYDSVNKIIRFYDDSSPVVPLINNVKSVTYTYYNAAGGTVTAPLTNSGWSSSVGNTTGSNNIHTVRRIGITLVMEDPDDFAQDITLKTDVNLRNMGS